MDSPTLAANIDLSVPGTIQLTDSMITKSTILQIKTDTELQDRITMLSIYSPSRPLIRMTRWYVGPHTLRELSFPDSWYTELEQMAQDGELQPSLLLRLMDLRPA